MVVIDVRSEDTYKGWVKISYLGTPNIMGGSTLYFKRELKNSHQEDVKFLKKTLKMMTESRLCD